MTTINAVNVGLSGASGTGNFAGTTFPTFVAPVLGAASATSINFGGSSLANFTSFTPFTPTIAFATEGNLSVTYINEAGSYSRIGNIVVANFLVSGTLTFSTSAGNLLVSNLPFTSNSSNANIAYGVAFIYGATGTTWPTGTYSVQGYLAPGTSSVAFLANGPGAILTYFGAPNFTTGAIIQISGTITYLL
jgi:hypothetical protein